MEESKPWNCTVIAWTMDSVLTERKLLNGEINRVILISLIDK